MDNVATDTAVHSDPADTYTSELLGAAGLEAYARALSKTLVVIPVELPRRGMVARRRREIRKSLATAATTIERAYAIAADMARAGDSLPPDAEWLLDNYYIVDELIRDIRDHLPAGFLSELPTVASGRPRVYEIARELVTHSDSELDDSLLEHFVENFQTGAVLSIGEVWALPVMLRLVLLEQLRALCEHFLHADECRVSVEQLLRESPAPAHFDFDSSSIATCGPTILRLSEQLRSRGDAGAASLKTLERHVHTLGWDLDELIRLEHRRQAANQVSIGNVITSMRLLSTLDWISFFEHLNHAEQVLRRDPAGVYNQMDFASRNRYRNVVERIAKRTEQADYVVANAVYALAQQHAGDELRAHVGYWLVGPGAEEFQRSQHYRRSTSDELAERLMRHPHATYFGSLGMLMLVGLTVVGLLLWPLSIPWWTWVVLLALSVVPLSDVALSIVNNVLTRILPPRLLPKLELRQGIPQRHPTLIVVPALMASERDVRELIDRMENHYLGNIDPMLRLALLTDFADAPTGEREGDAALLALAVAGIRELNARYGDESNAPFYLFHRRRQWNPSEEVWMGWERKRGKLMEFGRLLHGSLDTSFVVQEGDLEALQALRASDVQPFIITLDADTVLPRDTVRRLVGTLAHPLNRPRLSADCTRVESGYAILQPRVSVHLAGARQTRFVETFANQPGVDPYATATSDVYQDLFAEGSFTGKGIFDLHAFECALEHTFPENAILSHDLIEGCHARVALVSDIEVYDSYPTRYDADQKRTHRWVRGDWQIAPWLFRRVPSATGPQRNRLSFLSRWKILDNLRRSLFAPVLTAFLIVAWFSGHQAAWIGTLIGLAVLYWPVVLELAGWLVDLPKQKHPRNYLQYVVREFLRIVERCTLQLVMLLHRGVVMLDAIARTLFRMSISRKRMLQWTTAAAVESQLRNRRWSFLQQMWFCPVASIAIFAAAPPARGPALPFLIAWMLAPIVAYLVSQPRRSPTTAVGSGERHWLRQLASITWSYFEAYVDEPSNWLPPDNVQEYPREKIAHRISPTNEGLFLVSGLVARDFGFIGIQRLVELWERNWNAWQQLDQFRGHHYNWYETRTLQALLPRYVSMVDSGNLAACYLTLHIGILEDLLDAPVLDSRVHQGMLDSLDWLESAVRQMFTETLTVVRRKQADELLHSVHQLRTAIESTPGDAAGWWQCFEHIDGAIPKFRNLSQYLAGDAATLRLSRKVQILIQRFEGIRQDAARLLPWLSPPLQHDSSLSADGANSGKMLRLVQEPGRWRRLDRPMSLREIAALSAVATPDAEGDRAMHGGCSAVDLAASRVRQSAEATEGERHSDLALAQHDSPDGALAAAIHSAAQSAAELVMRLQKLADEFQRSATEMDFGFLYNPRRKLFSIGFNVEESRLDRSHYDMLCSEARLASYLAIAKGDTETMHWFRLGRQSTQIDGELLLVSWAGTMFEYLMPALFQKQYPGSLLTESCFAAIRRQRSYGKERGVPWGNSESAYASLASNSDYQYRSFGTPGLGIKRGLAKDLVVSPYSTMLALPLEPLGAIENLRALTAEGATGDWGFYDAMDYTPGRLRRGSKVVPVECYMAHHYGMSLLALANAVHDNVIQRRFHGHPWARANELLLQERVPQIANPNNPHAGQLEQAPLHREDGGLVSRRITGIQTATPRTHILTNGQASVMLSHVGGGYLQWYDQLVTRWRSDVTRDNWGTFIYLHDCDSGDLWSATYQPTLVSPDAYHVIFAIDKAEFHRRQGDIETVLEVTVSPEINAEVRQLRIVNHGSRERRLDVTSYAEIALNTLAADLAHPAFQKLFVETEYIAEETSLLARRRPRSAGGEPLIAVHTIVVPNGSDASVQYETSRSRFLGRNRSAERPAGATAERLEGHVGAVLDPAFALRCRITLAPDEAVTIGFTTSVARSREQALVIADQFHDQRGTQRAFELAWAFAQSETRHGNVDGTKFHLFQRLGSALLYPDLSMRGKPETLERNRMSQPGLWRYGISGDLPIIVCHVTETEHTALVSELIAAHRFLVGHGLFCDLVILNDYPGSYFDALQEQLQTLINDAQLGERRLGAIHLLRGAQLPAEDHVLIETVAACIFQGTAGSLAQQLDTGASRHPLRRPSGQVSLLRVDQPSHTYTSVPSNSLAKAAEEAHADARSTYPIIEFTNGLGGFVQAGRAYEVTLDKSRRTPAPWSNVIANPRFGTLVTESGGGCSWFLNSRENKLTSWCNDPVSDSPSELLYVRDEEARELWSPLPSLTAIHGEYRCQHGYGYSRFQHTSHGLDQEVVLTVAENDPVKYIRVRIHNPGDRARTLALTYYVEWVLGVTRTQTQMHVLTERDPASGALLARNHYSIEFGDQVAFLQVLASERTVTGDRRSFLGRNGTLLAPQALTASQLDDQVGAGLDPCGAIQTKITVGPGETEEVAFLIGAGENLEEARSLLAKYAQPESVANAMQQAAHTWQEELSALQVQTPNRALDIMVNGWLQYQTLSCRIWGRTAFYQSGGAYGFRDQLQDVMAVVHSRPDVTREQILRAAARQFIEGDVQHWWHPPGGKGTRTRFSDDFLFLPYVTDFYLRATGDTAILDAQVSFLTSPPLHENEQERYEQPQVSTESASLYEHCLRALEHGRRYGAHGLPLMGCGDWNDGMNKVGEEGQGESVWVAFFQIVVFEHFVDWMRKRGDDANAERFSAEAKRLRAAIEEHAWDGAWYRRAFFDNGEPLGSHENTECRIDSLAQSWAIIAGADKRRSRQAMHEAVQQLVLEKEKLILLFTPPFDKSDLDPGYIKGYLPGIRENGGQYTHAATWMIDAAARMGDGELAMRLFDILNPIHHATTPAEVERYHVEPYVVAADVYSVPPHVGLGGWTWYTGSASWTYRVAVESILGIHIAAGELTVRPCVPESWTEFEFTLRRGTTRWTVHMRRGAAIGKPFRMQLVEDGQTHHVEGTF